MTDPIEEIAEKAATFDPVEYEIAVQTSKQFIRRAAKLAADLVQNREQYKISDSLHDLIKEHAKLKKMAHFWADKAERMKSDAGIVIRGR
jgi:hypothetical protein